MIKLPDITGTNHLCRPPSPCRGMVAALLGILFLALMAAVPLATAGMARHAAYERAEARI
ncbi:hypothetical protein [Rhizobium sp. NFR03]|uniref:hypothetical protein n=1 Tax=Rhizobium sp. NFR03 TaxID=1566263 RepID=UPI0008D29222|nr:hypothetical protein [Rhizobium sp. NFR03]SER58301.1 hypothetical protein SAMN03159406_00569 [Rhizobium sp. NFR03]